MSDLRGGSSAAGPAGPDRTEPLGDMPVEDFRASAIQVVDWMA